MPAHLARDSFESLAQEVEFNDDATEGVGLSIPTTMFFNDGPQPRSSIESGFGDSRTRGRGHERHRVAAFDKLGAGRPTRVTKSSLMRTGRRR